jgi:uncharacterized protein YutE (UPF0331/DUF86 family)
MSLLRSFQQVDKNRIDKYLAQIAEEAVDITEVLTQSDEEIIASSRQIKSCKYSVIVISEAMASILQHILAKRFKTAIDGYTEAFMKSRQFGVISEDLANRLQPFIRFRNMLVHQYWRVDDSKFIADLRSGLDDFKAFIREIRKLTNESAATSNSGEGEA